MANIKPVICGEPKVTLPPDCSECDYLEARIDAIEQFLAQYEEVELVKIDKEGRTVTVYALGRTEVSEGDAQWTWEGLTPLVVAPGEEFDPMDGVSATSNKGQTVSLELVDSQPDDIQPDDEQPNDEEGGDGNE